MKKIALSCGVLLIAASMLFVACGKKLEITINKYFSVADATLVEAEMPDATSTETINVSMNQNAIAGGASYATVTSGVAASKILVGMKDQAGYYELTTSSSNRDYTYSFVITIDQSINLNEGESIGVQVAIVDENGDISQIWETSVGLIEAGTGELQVSLTFDNDKDVDLHLIEPEYTDEYGDAVSFYNRHIYYGHRWSTAGGELDLDSNAGCYIDGVNNENITYNDSTAVVVAGTYKVYVDLWENCDPTIATNYVVTVFYGGNLIASRSGAFDVDAPSTYNPIDESYVEANEPFLTFTIADRGQKVTKSFEGGPMTESAIEKEMNSVHQ